MEAVQDFASSTRVVGPAGDFASEAEGEDAPRTAGETPALRFLASAGFAFVDGRNASVLT
jgi:hypothetical protein